MSFLAPELSFNQILFLVALAIPVFAGLTAVLAIARLLGSGLASFFLSLSFGLFVLVRTSNPGAGELQGLVVAAGTTAVVQAGKRKFARVTLT